MQTKPLPSHPSLEQYRKQAKDLVKAHKAQTPSAIERIVEFHPASARLSTQQSATLPFTLSGAQLIIAREHGFESWPKFKDYIEQLNLKRKFLLAHDPSAVFLEAACIPMGAWHGSGTLEAAEAMLAERPEIARANIYVAAALGDAVGVQHFLAANPEDATAKGGPHEWDALSYLCFSRYLRLDTSRSEGFVRVAEALLDAGASPNSGWYEANDGPQPFWESAIYGAAGIARNVELTRLLLDRGADPNDEETCYHAAETYDNAVMEVLIESGKLNETSMTTLLTRKADWHDLTGMQYLLEHGADPNRMTRWRHSPFQHAIRRDNSLAHLRLMLDHGADPTLVNTLTGKSGAAMAARRGRGDLLRELETRAIAVPLEDLDRLVAACAKADAAAVRSIADTEPALIEKLVAHGGTLLAEFSGNGNTEGVRLLLELGIDVNTQYKEGDGYFEIAKDSTALHVAAWRAQHETVRLLLALGANVNAPDARGHTPLRLAVRACVDSHWKDRRTPFSIVALLQAGASIEGVQIPCGYAEADALLLAHATLGAGAASG